MTGLAVFDLDGTLVDSPAAIVAAVTAAFGAMGVPAPAAADIRATIGLPLPKAFGDLLGVPADDARTVLGVEQYQVAYRQLVLPRAATLVFPGVADGLAALRAEGFTLAVATSKFHASADALLTAAGLRDHFALVVGADEVTRPKPDPETGLLIARELGVPAGRAVMVGDTTHDLLMAAGAGMRSIAVTYGVHSLPELRSADPTWLADSFDDVVACLRAAATDQTGAGVASPVRGWGDPRP